jgi:hypothetical protein
MQSSQQSSSRSSASILLPSSRQVETLRSSSSRGVSLSLSSGLATERVQLHEEGEEKQRHETTQPQQLTKNNYSQHSLSNKIILSVVGSLTHLCGLSYDWKESNEQDPQTYRFHHQTVASNPITELSSLCLLLSLPLLSQSQVCHASAASLCLCLDTSLSPSLWLCPLQCSLVQDKTVELIVALKR